MEKLKVLDLFSGIGGFSLGLERTGGFETVAFCEINEYCRNEVLARHWPHVPVLGDVREVRGEDFSGVDVICGGFPCQDISVSGSKRGVINGERSGLWGEIVRISGEARPRYIVLENSPNLLSGGGGEWFGKVLSDLAQIGYDAEWDVLPASLFGAPHKRERVWIVAYASGIRPPKQGRFINAINAAPEAFREADSIVQLFQGGSVPFVCGRHDGVPNGVERLTALGNSIIPQIPEMIGYAILEAEKEIPECPLNPARAKR